MSLTDLSPTYAVTTASGPPSKAYFRVIKPLLDRLLVLISLPITLPVIVVLALLVMRDGHNPFFSQARVGRGGQTFRLLKLRTMVPNAETRLEEFLSSNPEARAEWDATQKLKNDPGITKIGRLLRKTSLDELPQLLNVLAGQMSLVGPRPMMPCQKSMYRGEAYYRLKPGITGVWQVSSRNGCEFAERAQFDASYERELSFVTDAKVLLRTVGVVLRATGY